MPTEIDLSALTLGDFAPHVGTAFVMATPEKSMPLTLQDASAGARTNRPGGSFSLLFVAPPGPWLPQGIYPVSHPALGTLEIFLVPMGLRPEGNAYEAVFA